MLAYVIALGTVNGMEVEESPHPALRKTLSVPSQQDIWPIMAAETDDSGYTPLLTACKIYRDYKVSGVIRPSFQNSWLALHSPEILPVSR